MRTSRSRGPLDVAGYLAGAGQGPAALVNGYPLPSLDHSRLDLVAGLIRERRPLDAWPRMLFEVADNVRVAGPLLGEPFAPGAALHRAAALGPDGVLAELAASNLRGRGGAGYTTASKWASCRKAPGTAHYVICNADEGEPGTFKDRVLLASHADLVFEGMTIAALAIGARQGIVYLRGEYLGEPWNYASAMTRVLDRLGADRLYQIGLRTGDREEWEPPRGTHIFPGWAGPAADAAASTARRSTPCARWTRCARWSAAFPTPWATRPSPWPRSTRWPPRPFSPTRRSSSGPGRAWARAATRLRPSWMRSSPARPLSWSTTRPARRRRPSRTGK